MSKQNEEFLIWSYNFFFLQFTITNSLKVFGLLQSWFMRVQVGKLDFFFWSGLMSLGISFLERKILIIISYHYIYDNVKPKNFSVLRQPAEKSYECLRTNLLENVDLKRQMLFLLVCSWQRGDGNTGQTHLYSLELRGVVVGVLLQDVSRSKAQSAQAVQDGNLHFWPKSIFKYGVFKYKWDENTSFD